MDSRGWTVGVDFGGTNVKVGLVNARGRVVRAHVVSSKAIPQPASFVDGVCRLVGSLAQSVGARPAGLRGVGVGAPGPVDVARGVVHSMVNVPGWHEVPLARLLERRLGCRCLVDNDVNLFTLAEWRFGAGRGAGQLVGLTLGTGVGGGLIMNGTLYRGACGAAGELGHMVVDPRGPRCGCGRRGCLETLVSAPAVVRLAQRTMRRRGARLTSQLVGRAARAGDSQARRVWIEIGRRLGVGLANIVNLLNPDCIVIGGGVANNWTLFAPTLIRTLRAEAMEVPMEAVRVVRGRLGDHAGIVGGAVLVWNEQKEKTRG